MATLNYLQGLSAGQCLAVKLGTGNGVSVLNMIKTFQAEGRQALLYEVVARRPRDIAACYADANRVERFFNWKAKLGLHNMATDTWIRLSNNLYGYGNVWCMALPTQTRVILAVRTQVGEDLCWGAGTNRLWGGGALGNGVYQAL